MRREKRYKISSDITIQAAPISFARDEAMLGLRKKNVSKYTQDQFVKKILQRDVLVVMLDNDPVAYAIKENGKISEIYIEWLLRNTKIKEYLIDFKE